MIHDVRFQENWDRIKNNFLKKNSKKRENLNRIDDKYNVGDHMMLWKPGLRCRLTVPNEGPYPILEVGTNGTVEKQ
jgi:hypothetical protein